MDASAPFVLGIDGGGTSTIAWLGQGRGNVVGRGVAGPSNVKAVGTEAARAAIDAAIGRAFADASLERRPVLAACMGLAGFGRVEDQELLRTWSQESSWAERLLPVTDGDLVLAAGTPAGHGIAVIAGTGSIAVGRKPGGATARAGGWGYLVGDEGSGYRVVLNALTLVMRRADGREPLDGAVSHLTRRLLDALNVDEPSCIVPLIYDPGFTRTRISALAPAVVMAAEEEPMLARRLLEPAGRELSELVLAVCRQLDWDDPTLPLALAGGFLLAAPPVRRSLVDHLERQGHRVEIARVLDPVRGALILAEQAANLS